MREEEEQIINNNNKKQTSFLCFCAWYLTIHWGWVFFRHTWIPIEIIYLIFVQKMIKLLRGINFIPIPIATFIHTWSFMYSYVIFFSLSWKLRSLWKLSFEMELLFGWLIEPCTCIIHQFIIEVWDNKYMKVWDRYLNKFIKVWDGCLIKSIKVHVDFWKSVEIHKNPSLKKCL